ncbi:hypothetical protein Prede_0624 [Prevotella dentalis DSM 3688]|uniref:Uncharacterized protein n=1 Tax=Prevotella dentalis (strain ATCC 49559 / DSM 3688 / JCM 13448 / NCTC 12043 / ES 2772) TaxID=908937 RepID=L0JAU2_PREDD|nr:hypothetical protein Prede_0624 [Prevotella dentalis DSM 3688]
MLQSYKKIVNCRLIWCEIFPKDYRFSNVFVLFFFRFMLFLHMK